MGKRSTYVPTPELPPHLQERFTTILEVIAQERTMTSGAQKLGLSRNRFQTLVNRTLTAMLQASAPQTPGRPPTPEKQAELSRQVEKLSRENERLRDQVDMTQRMLSIVGKVMRGEVRVRSRSRRGAPTEKQTAEDPTGEDPDGRARMRLSMVDEVCKEGLAAAIAANALGASVTSVRRWRSRSRRGVTLCSRRGPARRPTTLGAHDAALVEDRVRELCGLVGAASLSKSFPFASRRDCDALKKCTLRALERERIEATQRVTITVPGVLRGFDQMYVATSRGLRLALFSADGAVSYRTSVLPAEHYDGPTVAVALENDYAQNGAPLVQRLDRAGSHGTPDVLALLRSHGVLVLHGPPHHPRFYGQLERQNREHRAFFDAEDLLDPDDLSGLCARMLYALNCLWKRPTLGWRTAREVWMSRPAINDDREELRDEVREHTARIARRLGDRPAPADLAERLATEHVLSARGYLQRKLGGWC